MNSEASTPSPSNYNKLVILHECLQIRNEEIQFESQQPIVLSIVRINRSSRKRGIVLSL